MKSQGLKEGIIALKEKKDFFEFDAFLIEKMLHIDLLQYEKSDREEYRIKAYRKFVKSTGEASVAALQTIQKWFGIHGKTVPGREQIFEIGFALQLSGEEVSEYLVQGIKEPDFQVNDYREVIFMYALQHQLNYEEALDMIDEFQAKLSWDTKISHHNHTSDLLGNYYVNCHLDKEEFIQWMLQYAEEFKGYSKTVLDYFRLLKKEILTEIKEDAKWQLEFYLGQTNFFAWEQKRHLSEKKRSKTILQYLSSKTAQEEGSVSDSLKTTISELLEMSQISVDSNQQLLMALYTNLNHQYRNFKTNNKKDEEKKRVPLDMNLMSDKYLSDILNHGINKEKQIRLAILNSCLSQREPNENCDAEILEFAGEYGCPKDRRTNEQVLQWIKQKQKEQGRRCHLIKRKDILPLLLITAQKRYQRIHRGEEYQSDKAKEFFFELANMTLSSCNMEPLDPNRYEFDAILCLCFASEDGNTLSDVLEGIVEMD